MLNKKMDDDIQFQDMDSWQGSGNKFGLTFKQIILMHINRCVINGSVEYRGGFYEQKLSTSGSLGSQVVKTYVESKIDNFCNSVRILRALILYHFSKGRKDDDKKLKDKLNVIDKTFKDIKSDDDKKEKKNTYQQDKINIYMEIFEFLLDLCHEKNFFEERSIEDKMK